jgi:hexosaminidase
MAALAEVDWTQENRKSWSGFQRRITRDYQIYQALGYNYCPGSYKVNIATKDTNNVVQVTLQSEIYKPDIRYTTNNSLPTMQSERYSGPFQVQKGAIIRAAVFVDGKLMEEPAVLNIK